MTGLDNWGSSAIDSLDLLLFAEMASFFIPIFFLMMVIMVYMMMMAGLVNQVKKCLGNVK